MGCAQQTTSDYKNPQVSESKSVKVDKQLMSATVSEAISTWIDSTYNNSNKPKTLILGRNSEFPDISLPSNINNTQCKIVDYDSIPNLEMTHEEVYLKVMTWFNEIDAEVIIISFDNNMHPQQRCTMSLEFSPQQNHYALMKYRKEFVPFN